MIDADATVVAKEGLSLADLDGEAVVLSPDTGSYYGLNGVATRAFELAQQPRRIEDIIDAIYDEYEADRAVIRNDVLRFFEEMGDLGLVEVRDPEPRPTASNHQ